MGYGSCCVNRQGIVLKVAKESQDRNLTSRWAGPYCPLFLFKDVSGKWQVLRKLEIWFPVRVPRDRDPVLWPGKRPGRQSQ